jgi:hypothetical protein
VSWLFVQTQLPTAHVWPMPQACPQPPQLLGSFWRLTQAPLQKVSPLEQAQLPLLQPCPPPQ